MLKKTSNVLVLALLSHVAMSAPCVNKRELAKRDMPTISGWVATWGDIASPELLKKYDEISYSFVNVTDQYVAAWNIDGDLSAKYTGNNSVEDTNPPVLLSIGGWSYSRYVSCQMSLYVSEQ